MRYRPILWGIYSLNYINGCFTVACEKRRRTVWDIWRFFQGKFTQALIDWKIADKEHLEHMMMMKDSRSKFDAMNDGMIREYCLDECQYLSKLMAELIAAHDAAGLKLLSFYGAGSTASALLTKIGVRNKRGQQPEKMRDAMSRAFFGGRFENSVIGEVPGPVYNYDIASAYPYQIAQLPCLECGKWEYVVNGKGGEKCLSQALLACLHWSTESYRDGSWGCLPVRHSTGTIRFPLGGRGGWTWKAEFLAARTLNPDLNWDCGWLYSTDCHHQPFRDIPNYYRERVTLGKDSKGIVLKLGLNSIYGKTAQSKGYKPPYQSWVWAGNITSGTRAQLLQALTLTDPQNILMFATDSVTSTVPLTFPKPVDTGTFDLAKPLGSWESSRFEQGIFAVRPGVFFPMNPTEDQIKQVRARGLGKKILYQKWRDIVDAYHKHEEGVTISGGIRFIGALSGVREVAGGYVRDANYGEWIDWPIKIGFSPKPKRRDVTEDGRLLPWEYLNWESEPYKASTLSAEALMLQMMMSVLQEQPDFNMGDID